MSAPLPRRLTFLLILLAPLAALWGGVEGVLRNDDLADAGNGWILPARLLFALAGLAAGGLAWHNRRPILDRVASWTPVRLALYGAFAAVVLTTLLRAAGWIGDDRFLARMAFFTCLYATLDAWLFLMLRFPGRLGAAPRGSLRVFDLLAANLLLMLLACEGLLALAARVSPSPLFWDEGSIVASIDAFRRPPGAMHHGTPLNSGGYCDTEFFAAGDDDYVCAVLADSFGLGVVPRSYNFATVAESELRERIGPGYDRVALHNLGIPGIGMHHYAHILRTEALPLNPRHVLLCVFVGNDIAGLKRARSHRYSMQGWWVWRLPARLIKLGREVGAGGAVLDATGQDIPEGDVPAHILDPSKETPTFTPEGFLEIETDRVTVCDPERERTREFYRDFFEALDYMHGVAGARLAVVVIPDEFQVNDDLYARVRARYPAPAALDRDLPQTRINRHCRDAGIPCLDLLPLLRNAETESHTYHLRDTHWNARGNRVAGEAIAAFLAEQASTPPAATAGDR